MQLSFLFNFSAVSQPYCGQTAGTAGKSFMEFSRCPSMPSGQQIMEILEGKLFTVPLPI